MLQVKLIYVLKLINFVYVLFELTTLWAGTGSVILQELNEWCTFSVHSCTFLRQFRPSCVKPVLLVRNKFTKYERGETREVFNP